MFNSKCQVSTSEVLSDKRKSGREKPWALHKLQNTYLAIAYDSINPSKALRLRECASWLEFVRTSGGMLKLHNANFCRVRLCPVCAWRRSLKTYGQVRKIMNVACNDYSFIFLTLTVRNCVGDNLSDQLTNLSKAWDRFIKYKDIKSAFKGYYRATEVTHNLNDNTFHPHFHCIIAVNPSYFTSRDYIKHDRFRELWQKAVRCDYLPEVNVQRVKSESVEAACAEVAKYTVKSCDYLCFEDWDLTVDTVTLLDKALDKRRFIAFGGCFKAIHKSLNLDDVDTGDFIHSDSDACPDHDEIFYYAWHSGYSQYVKCK